MSRPSSGALSTPALNNVPGQLHALLLRLAGRVPDDLVAESRAWLASGHHGDVAQALAFGVAAGGVAIDPMDVDLIAAVLTDVGADTDILHDVQRGAADRYPPCTMAPVAPGVLAEHGDAVPVCLDLTGAYPTPWGVDEIDGVAVATVGALSARLGLVGLWRAWRYPVNGSPWPEPRRVYLVEATREIPVGRLPLVANRVQGALAAVGEQDPQVEVVAAGGEESVYQAWVRGYGALLWADAPTAPLRIARAFDRVDPRTGPTFDPGHPCLDDAEQAMVMEYLEAGEPVLTTGDCLPDVFDPEQGETVPMDLRTDGRWIWSETTMYYLDSYGLAPDPDLLGSIRKRDFEPPRVGSVGLHLAMVAILGSGRDLAWA